MQSASSPEYDGESYGNGEESPQMDELEEMEGESYGEEGENESLTQNNAYPYPKQQEPYHPGLEQRLEQIKENIKHQKDGASHSVSQHSSNKGHSYERLENVLYEQRKKIDSIQRS